MMKATVNGQNTFEVEFEKGNRSGKSGGERFTIDVRETGPKSFHVLKNNSSYTVEVLEKNLAEKKYVLLINGRKYETVLKNDFDLLLESMGIGSGTDKLAKEVKAPMPGLVLDILVQEGSTVAKGDPLLILEAMKMENVLKSPADGVVKKVSITKGVAVEKNQVLVSFN